MKIERSSSLESIEQDPTFQGVKAQVSYGWSSKDCLEESATNAPIYHQRSPLQVFIDLFSCIQFFIVSKAGKLFHFIQSVFQHEKNETAPAPLTPPSALSRTQEPMVAREPESPSNSRATQRRHVADEATFASPQRRSRSDEMAVALAQPQRREIPLASSAILARQDHTQEEDSAFHALIMSEEEQEKTKFIIQNLANTSALLMPAAELRRFGEDLKTVHPLKFLEHILISQDLSKNFHTMRTRSFGLVWSQFADEFAQKIGAIHRAGRLTVHLGAFARSIRRDLQIMQQMISSSNFRDFMDYLADTVPTIDLTNTHSDSPSLGSEIDSVSSFTEEDAQGARAPMNPPESFISSQPRRALSDATTPVRQRENRLTSDTEPQSPSRLLQNHPSLRSRGASFGLSSISPMQSPPFMSPRSRNLIYGDAGERAAAAAPQFNPMMLPMTEEHKQKLARLLADIANKSSANLLWNLFSLKADWTSLRDVHPLRLLCEVFHNPSHIANIARIIANDTRKGYFLSDFAETLKNGATAEQLAPYISEFSKQMGAPEGAIAAQIIVGGEYDWKHVIRYLMGIKQIIATAEIDMDGIE